MKKTYVLLVLLLICLITAVSCARSDPDSGSDASSDAEETYAVDEGDENTIFIATPNHPCFYTIVSAVDSQPVLREKVNELALALGEISHAPAGSEQKQPVMIDTDTISQRQSILMYEILIGETYREEALSLYRKITTKEYMIKAFRNDATGAVRIVILFTTPRAGEAALDDFMETCFHDGVCSIPVGFEKKGSENNPMITSDIPQLRDPAVLLADDGTYYVYGTGWIYYKNTTGSLSGHWEGPFSCVEVPAEADTDHWAPEVHRYQGSYYMFTTYHSTVTGHRGVTILKSDSPEGPFVEITGGQVTPHDWDAIDGTLYVDRDGQPWLVFVHEWTSTEDGIGRMAAAKLSSDLTCLISEPIELFGAKDASWARNVVTDGCFLYETQDGQLLMIWSNWDDYGYCIGIARSDDGLITGKWIQEEKPLYSRSICNDYDGGHGMIFTDPAGQKWISLHSPNAAEGDRREVPIFIPVAECDGSLYWSQKAGE